MNQSVTGAMKQAARNREQVIRPGRRTLLGMFLVLAVSAAQGWMPVATPVGQNELALFRQYLNEPAAGTATGSAVGDIVKGSYVVSYEPGAQHEAGEAIVRAGGRVVRWSQTGGDFVVAGFSGTEQNGRISEILLRSPAITCVEPQRLCHATFVPNDPSYLTQQWGHWVMYSDRAWDLSQGSTSIKVAIVDQGVDYRHPDLATSFDSALRGYNFIDSQPDPAPHGSSENHATHVAGIIAAGLNNAIGVAGWTRATLYSCRALDTTGSGLVSDVADAIRWAADQGARIINLSLGTASSVTVLEQACNYAWNKGCLLLAASGNNGQRGVTFPGAYANVIAVAALDTGGVIAGFSNYGPEQELIAPGVRILSSVPGTGYMFMDGTSMATPEVAGVAALILALRPELSNRTVRAILGASAVDMGSAGKDIYYGYGLVNAWRALQLTQMLDEHEQTWSLPGRTNRLPQFVRAREPFSLEGISELMLVDAQGRLVKNVRADRSDFVLDVPSGVYFAVEQSGLLGRVTVLPNR